MPGRWNSPDIFTTSPPAPRLRAPISTPGMTTISRPTSLPACLPAPPRRSLPGWTRRARERPSWCTTRSISLAKTWSKQDRVSGGVPKAVRVYGPDGKEAPAQLEDGKVLFLAQAPSVGYTVYHLLPAENPAANETVKVTESSLENARYRVQLNQDGDVSSIYDKSLNKELLSAPIRLAISTDVPKQYPAWNMDFDQEQAAPRAYVSGPAQIRIEESGPVRVSLEVTRKTENSTFVQTIRLSAGDAGNRVEFGNAIDWRTLAANLKVAFPLSPANEDATYNWDVGTIQRPNAQERQFEVASHRWIDLTDKSGSFGATILTEYKNGSDKPNDHTIRLTLLRSPGMQPPTNGRPQGYSDQANQDWGHHEFLFGLAGHAGGWNKRKPIGRPIVSAIRSSPFKRQSIPVAGQELFPASPQQLQNPRARSQESGSGRRNHSPHGRARRSSSARCARLVRRAYRRRARSQCPRTEEQRAGEPVAAERWSRPSPHINRAPMPCASVHRPQSWPPSIRSRLPQVRPCRSQQ